MNKTIFKLMLLTTFFCNCAYALPEDAQKELTWDAESTEFDLDLGLIILKGSPEQLVQINQGTLHITGLQVTITRVDGIIQVITATGQPAHFQQQPQIDQAIVYVSGNEIIFDNAAQLLTVDTDAELIQNEDTLTGCHLEYDLKVRKGSITSCNDEKVTMLMQPGSKQ